MKRYSVILAACAALAACASVGGPDPVAAPPAAGDPLSEVRPQARPAALNTAARRPPEGARTVEQFDTTTREERAAAVAAAAAPPAGGPLGVTIASLGDPARPGFWIETPLAKSAGPGRVSYNGKSVQVELIPIDGPPTAGSRMSLAAMRLIEAPLTGLPEVQVFADG